VWRKREGASNLHATAPEALLRDQDGAPKTGTTGPLRISIVAKVKLRGSGKNDGLAQEQLVGDWEVASGYPRSTRHETVGHRRLVGTT
jgi:hypothetical protein